MVGLPEQLHIFQKLKVLISCHPDDLHIIFDDKGWVGLPDIWESRRAASRRDMNRQDDRPEFGHTDSRQLRKS